MNASTVKHPFTLSVLAAMTVATLQAAVPVVSNVTMSQDTFRLVTVTYTLEDAPAVITVDVQTNGPNGAWISIGGEAVRNASGDVWRKVGNELAAGQSFNGTIMWRPDLSWPDHKIANGGARAVITAWSLDNTPDYMAVDISNAALPNTQTYYPAADFVPGGPTSHLYKTTMLLMRKIMAKDVTWTMGSTTMETQRNSSREATHQVKLDNNYYIGIYQITQAQWDLIQPERLAPSYYNNAKDRAMRPVEQVCYNEIRNNADCSKDADTTYDWPADPNPGSFLGKLYAKTGLKFDLPSEAQWEFAARAGNGDTKWGDGSAIMNTDDDPNLNVHGRYERNGGKTTDGSGYFWPDVSCDATYGTAIVGTYRPNAWGIYDMSGNVWEWCLDWYTDNISALNGAVNATSASQRARRGGSWNDKAEGCRPARRGSNSPRERNGYLGFRVVCQGGLQ